MSCPGARMQHHVQDGWKQQQVQSRPWGMPHSQQDRLATLLLVSQFGSGIPRIYQGPGCKTNSGNPALGFEDFGPGHDGQCITNTVPGISSLPRHRKIRAGTIDTGNLCVTAAIIMCPQTACPLYRAVPAFCMQFPASGQGCCLRHTLLSVPGWNRAKCVPAPCPSGDRTCYRPIWSKRAALPPKIMRRCSSGRPRSTQSRN